VLLFFFGQRFWNWRIGLLASLVLATSPEWMRWSTYARSDMVLVFFLTLAGLTFFRMWEERAAQRRTVYLFYLSIGLATLAKGPLGIVLPGLISLTFLVAAKDLRFIRQMRLIEGIGIVAVVALSWYLLALQQAGWEFFSRQILNENIYRFFDNEQGGPSRDHAWYYYGPALCAGMFPWSLFFPALIHFLYRLREQLREPKLLYLLVWTLASLVFFTLASGKRTNYILSLYPPVALLFAIWWEELVEGNLVSSVLAQRLARINALVLCAFFTLFFAFLVAHSAGFDLDHIVSPFLHPRDQANLPLVASSLQSQFSVVVVWLSMLAVAIGWYLWGLKTSQWMYVFSALVVAASSSLYFTDALFHPLIAWERTYKPFMLGVRSTVKNAPLFFYKDTYDYGAIFYANRHIPPLMEDLSTLKVEENAASQYYLLLWEEDWPLLSATDQRLEYLVTSEGKGPDKKHRLVLAALMPSPVYKNEEDKVKELTPPSPPAASPPTEEPHTDLPHTPEPPLSDTQPKATDLPSGEADSTASPELSEGAKTDIPSEIQPPVTTAPHSGAASETPSPQEQTQSITQILKEPKNTESTADISESPVKQLQENRKATATKKVQKTVHRHQSRAKPASTR
jgi:hypothetical protein